MEMELNTLQLVGIWLMVTGLILNTVIFVFSYYKVVARLKRNEDETEGDHKDDKENDDSDSDGEKKEEKKSFPIIRFVFHFRKILKDLTVREKRENFELIIVFLKWALIFAVGMIAAGLVLFLAGFLIE